MSDPVQDNPEGGDLDFEEGRYLYCVVKANERATFTADGIEGETVSLLVEDGIGAVVQPVDSVFDSDDVTQVRKWLLTHQSVVDTAGDAFGTPLPFRFDTIFQGNDEVVIEWIGENREEISAALNWLAGRWEYRIEVRWDEAVVTDTLREEDQKLRELMDSIEEASSGTGFLLESQYEQRLNEGMQERSQELETELVERIEPYAVEIQRSGAESSVIDESTKQDLDTAVELSLLADSAHEEEIGEELEEFASRPGHDVRYTGPWPPYSHAPAIGGDEG